MDVYKRKRKGVLLAWLEESPALKRLRQWVEVPGAISLTVKLHKRSQENLTSNRKMTLVIAEGRDGEQWCYVLETGITEAAVLEGVDM